MTKHTGTPQDGARTPAETGDAHPWHALPAEELAARAETAPHGLSREEAAERLLRYGPNRLREVESASDLTILLHQFQSPLIYILLAATAVTVALGEFIDSGVIAAALLLNAVIGFTQERRAEASVKSLMKLVSPQARVIRGGREYLIDGSEVVPGDVAFLESGTRVPADMRLFSATALAIDESLLTGESLPVRKTDGPVAESAGLADRKNMAYTGSIVTSGRGRGYVVATGAATELGAIAESLRIEEAIQTPLQERMSRFGKTIGAAVGVACLFVFVLGIALGETFDHMLLVAVGLAVAAIPEGLPVVFTITLALGVRRMARQNAIIRRLPAVETLGSTTTIGSDKTGTLTENRMTVQEIWSADRLHSVDAAETAPAGSPLYQTLLAGVLTNEAEAYETDDGYDIRGDPTEAALLVAAQRLGIDKEEAREAYRPFAEIPFEPELQYSASIREDGDAHWVFVKGAPERVLAMCEGMLSETGPQPLDTEAVHRAASDMASRGLRVLAMAYRRMDERLGKGVEVPEPGGLVFLGLQGMADPPRQGVADAIAGCEQAGIRVLMITGDHLATAKAIGAQLGIGREGQPVLTGADLDAMDEQELRQRVRETSIYARVSPENKLQVVRALRELGEVVAVTGDGVNDAPALRAADIGVAMGRSGTDVAREASDMVLADDNFVSLKEAVLQGRVTFDNLRKVTFFLVSTGVATIVAITMSLIFRWPLPLLPAQLLWLNVVTNGLQDVALAFEPAERGVLSRPPRPRSEGIVSRVLWERTVLCGIVMAIGTLALFRWELDATDSIDHARTVALTTMVLFMMVHIGNARSEYLSAFQKSPISNPFLFIATAAALLVHFSALYLPPTQYVLRVEDLGIETWARMAVVALAVLAVGEGHKILRRPGRGAAEQYQPSS